MMQQSTSTSEQLVEAGMGHKEQYACSEDGPTHWDLTQPMHFLRIEKDKLTLRYKGPGNQQQDVGTIRSNKPFACNSCIDYFEIKVHEVDFSKLTLLRRSHVVIGLSLSHGEYVSTRNPGFDAYSWGYSSIDGKVYHDGRQGKSYSDAGFGPGDTIGCGIIYHNPMTNSQQIFFTKNGTYSGVAFSHVNKNNKYYPFFPTVGLHSAQVRVTANFGQEKFVFDVDTLRDELNLNAKKQIANIQVSTKELHLWIREYLYISGFTETLGKFEQNSSETDDLSLHMARNTEITKNRRSICQNIENGNIDVAFSSLALYYPSVTKLEHLMIKLHCQHIIEAIRRNDVYGALEYAQQNLQQYTKNLSIDHDESSESDHTQTKQKADQKLILDTLGLLAYIDPQKSPVAHLFQIGCRLELSQEVNRCILEASGEATHSTLERAQMQLQVLSDLSREEGIGGFHFSPYHLS